MYPFLFLTPWFISLRVQWNGIVARANSRPKVLLTVSEGSRKDTGINYEFGHQLLGDVYTQRTMVMNFLRD